MLNVLLFGGWWGHTSLRKLVRILVDCPTTTDVTAFVAMAERHHFRARRLFSRSCEVQLVGEVG